MPFNEDGSRKAAYKKSGFKMKGWSAFKQDDDDPPKGRIGSEYRKKEYDKRGWAYDDTIPGFNTETNTETNKGDTSGSTPSYDELRKKPRYAGLSNARIDEILRPKKDARGKRIKYKDSSHRWHGFTEAEKKSMQEEQAKRRAWHQSYKDQYVSPSSSDRKPNASSVKELPESLSFLGAFRKSPLKFGRKYKK